MLRQTLNTDFNTVIFLLCLCLIIVARVNNAKRFYSFMRILLDSRYFVIHRQDRRIFDVFSTSFLLQTSLSIAITLKLIYAESFNNPSYAVFAIAAVCFLFFGLKFTLEKLFASIFKVKSLIIDTIHLYIAYINAIGIILFVLNTIIVYTTLGTTFLLYSSLILTVIVLSLCFILSVKRNLKSIQQRPYYYILYFCIFKITPYIIMYRVWLQAIE